MARRGDINAHEARLIYAWYWKPQSDFSYREIAHAYGVRTATVGDICCRVTWKDATRELARMMVG